MNAATFNVAIAVLDQDLADHRAAFRVVLRAYVSAPSLRYVQEMRRHYRRIQGIEQERLAYAEQFRWHIWRE